LAIGGLPSFHLDIYHKYLPQGEARSRRFRSLEVHIFLTLWTDREEILFGIVSTGLEAGKLLDFVLPAAVVGIFSQGSPAILPLRPEALRFLLRLFETLVQTPASRQLQTCQPFA
jgi:hypothetical protein